MKSHFDISDPTINALQVEQIPLQRQLLSMVKTLITNAREKYSDNNKIVEACNALETQAREGVPIAVLCQLRQALYKMLKKKDRSMVRGDIRLGAQGIAREIDALRDTNGIRLPEKIITCRMRWCPEDPWYALRYEHDDPVEAGTTGGPHIVLVRTPDRIDVDGQDLPSDIFLKSGLLDDTEGRIHSECFFGDILEQVRCDCGPQLKHAMQHLNERKKGVIFYVRQEGRGMGLTDKMDALELSEGRKKGTWVGKNHDTKSAMMAQGYDSAELRQYGFLAPMVRGLGIKTLHLMSHNPVKLRSLRDAGIQVFQLDAAGEAGGEENLTEFFWKIVDQGYEHISARSMIGELDKELALLATGKEIDPRLLHYLRRLLDLIRNGKAAHVDADICSVIIAHDHLLG